jgi:uncharacterized protein YecE (DUF72 family)
MIRIGISGWRYAPWRGVFYPDDLPQRRELEYASRRFETVEINGTFYSLQRPESFQRWYDETAEDFRFAVKSSRFITHMKRLASIEAPLANFFAQGLLRLGRKLGPILWQFPPSFAFEAERLDRFLNLLPRSHDAAGKLARRHDHRVTGRSVLTPVHQGRIRHALEARHPSFFTAQAMRLLRKRKVALVFSDSGGEWPYGEDVTADFVYLRLHGAEELYASGYSDETLDRWAERIRAWTSGGEPSDAEKALDAKPPRRESRDAFIYFDNDAKVKAPFDALKLRERLGLPERG